MKHDTAIPIGSGGMGEVFKAWDPELERCVALKYLRHDDPELVERLLREARAQARVDHPAVCQVYEVGEDDGRPYIAMQYVEGRPPRGRGGPSVEQKVLVVSRWPRRSRRRTRSASSTATSSRATSSSPTDEGGLPHPYVLDFGIAREEEVAGLTVTGQVLGTPGYLSPEQARGEMATLDRRTDIFSLGVILYELLGGAGPSTATAASRCWSTCSRTSRCRCATRAPGVPRDLETVVMTCLEKDPDRRYPSARALADDLGRFLAGEPVQARPIRARERLLRLARKHRVAASALAVAAVALAALTVVSVGGWVKYTADLKRERDVAEARNRGARGRRLPGRRVLAPTPTSPRARPSPRARSSTAAPSGSSASSATAPDPGPSARDHGRGLLRFGAVQSRSPLLERGLEEVTTLPEHTVLPARGSGAARRSVRQRNELDAPTELWRPFPE